MPGYVLGLCRGYAGFAGAVVNSWEMCWGYAGDTRAGREGGGGESPIARGA